MYPSGVGTSYADPRRSNFTKTQSLGYNNGRGVLKDFAETTANVAPHPTDVLGSNLRRGKGLTFSRGIAQFDGENVPGSQPGSRPGSAYEQARDGSGSSRPQSALISGREANPHGFPHSGLGEDPMREAIVRREGIPASHRSGGGGEGLSGRANDVGSARYGNATDRQSQKSSFRPQSAPSRRGPVTYGRNDLPDWAREQGSSPSFAKTVENQRGARPGSARARGAPAAGLPLSSIPKWISLDKKAPLPAPCSPTGLAWEQGSGCAVFWSYIIGIRPEDVVRLGEVVAPTLTPGWGWVCIPSARSQP